jgi:CheY-like chemotaxis protein
MAGLGGAPRPALWDELEDLLAPQRVMLEPACSIPETFARIQAGGLDLAVLWAGPVGDNGLRTLERIRQLTDELPCLLVTPDPTAAMLRRALDLRAVSVIGQPVAPTLLASWMVRILDRAGHG